MIFTFRGLDIFAQFFVDPLMLQDSMEREREAVDSEHEGRLNNDNVRLYAALDQLAKPNHPMSKFGCGNKKTLTLPSLFRPDKPRIPFEDMDCKLRFKVQCMAPS